MFNFTIDKNLYTCGKKLSIVKYGKYLILKLNSLKTNHRKLQLMILSQKKLFKNEV